MFNLSDLLDILEIESPHDREAMLASAKLPRWELLKSNSDRRNWRRWIFPELRRLWHELSLDARIILIFQASECTLEYLTEEEQDEVEAMESSWYVDAGGAERAISRYD